MWVFVDVDGTLIDQDDNPRPYIPEFILGLKELECTIVIWSAGGNKYAEQKFNMICNRLYYGGNTNWDLRKLIRSYLSKHNHIDAALILKDDQFYVDDVQELLDSVQKQGHGTFKVPFYNDPSGVNEKDDRWLLKARDAVAMRILTLEDERLSEGSLLVVACNCDYSADGHRDPCPLFKLKVALGKAAEELVRPKETPDPKIAEENKERERLKDLSERFS